jgi:hypothetical protein
MGLLGALAESLIPRGIGVTSLIPKGKETELETQRPITRDPRPACPRGAFVVLHGG